MNQGWLVAPQDCNGIQIIYLFRRKYYESDVRNVYSFLIILTNGGKKIERQYNGTNYLKLTSVM